MNRLLIILCVGFFGIPYPSSQAREGMWPPGEVPGDVAAKAGLKGSIWQDLSSQQEIAGVVSLGGCTGSFVSPQGLIITNHHCAYGSIQFNATKDKPYLQDGFAAATNTLELPAAPGSRVYIKVAERDVTTTMLQGLDDNLSGYNIHELLAWRRKQLIQECEKEAIHRCRVVGFYGDSQFRLIKNLIIKDVRLVYAPPTSIGAFGGDTDNWMWPRQAGDFAFLRAYVAKDGQPAAYDPNNVPYQPAAYLTINPQGVKEQDFVAVAGYPGRTNRWRTASEVAYQFKEVYPRRLRFLSDQITKLTALTADDPKLTITYAAQLAGMANYRKNIAGQLAAFGQHNIVASKAEAELGFRKWLQQQGKTESLKAFGELELVIRERQVFGRQEQAIRALTNSQAWGAAYEIYRWALESQRPDSAREPGYQERDRENFHNRLARLDRRFAPEVDRNLWQAAIAFLQQSHQQNKTQATGLFPPLSSIYDKSGQQLSTYLAGLYQNAAINTSAGRLALANQPLKALSQSTDQLVQAVGKAMPYILERERREKDLDGRYSFLQSQINRDWRQYLKQRGTAYYPDANGTLRLTFGHLMSFKAASGQPHPQFTFAQEILAKEGPEPFQVPAPLKAAIQAKKFGSLAMAKGLPINFIADLDITGGNSGSATLNSQGELVGLVFDGNIEGVISDWLFLPEATRSIHVDVRYILWLMQEVYPAPRLIKEMKLTAPKS